MGAHGIFFKRMGAYGSPWDFFVSLWEPMRAYGRLWDALGTKNTHRGRYHACVELGVKEGVLQHNTVVSGEDKLRGIHFIIVRGKAGCQPVAAPH